MPHEEPHSTSDHSVEHGHQEPSANRAGHPLSSTNKGRFRKGAAFSICGLWTENSAMKISVTEAKGQLSELVRRAEAGEETILTHRGKPAVRLAPMRPDAKTRRRLLEEFRAASSARASTGPHAAASQDDLYDEDGLPG